MADFEPLKLRWDGVEYRVAPSRMMQGLAKVESVITFAELLRYLSDRQTVPVYTLAMAYGALLRHAGANVRDIELARQIGHDQETASTAIDILLALLSPPEDAPKAEGGAAEAPENPPVSAS